MEPVQTLSELCPYCGESIELIVDATESEQEYVEDCSVCCSPMVVNVTVDADEVVYIELRQENG
ncbi:CPXCG motif-containing cysteine-rich protein [Pokkaliibacter sp. CJK22405]|uniref:CPXCG motif-containing cysteine-rich protein n=1 Tax=Pokkaliibacter sp. CJK22405 TaxID=3384615 RepID=UPI00398510B4